MLTTTQLSKQYLIDAGYTVDKVEHYDYFSKRRKDLFSFGDLLAFNENEIIIIQTTSKSNMSARRKKIKSNPITKQWLNQTRKIHIHGWYKDKNKWVVKVEEING